jgi:hypothetical protein
MTTPSVMSYEGGASMRRAACAVLPLPTLYRGERLSAFRWLRPGARLFGVLGAAMLAVVALAGSLVAGPLGLEHGSHGGTTARLPVAAWASVSRVLGRDDPAYRAGTAGAGLAARNPRQKLAAEFSPAGVSVRSGALLLGMRLRGYGYGDRFRALPAVAPTASANRVLYHHGSLTEWYQNGPLGLEQGFTLTARPIKHGSGPLRMVLGLSGNAAAALSRGGGAVTFSHAASSLSYRGLIVTDARGQTLPAWLELRGGQLLLDVNDRGAQYPLRIDPFIQQAKLTASDGAIGDHLGFSVAISGNTIVAAEPQDNVGANINQGAVYVFVKPKRGWQSGTETAKLTASDGAANDGLGGGFHLQNNAVGISGDTIVAGASNATVNGNFGQGAVYVFVKPKGGWRSETETAKLTASDGAAGDNLGVSAAVDGDTVVAGPGNATVNGNAAQGAVYVFVKPKGGWASETETAKLTASDGAANDLLGYSAVIEGNTIVAGAAGATVNGNQFQGALYVFVKPKRGWQSGTETAKLTASDGAAGDGLGAPVAIAGNTVVASALFATVNGNPLQGAAYVFVKPKRGWQSGTEAAKLTASDGGAFDTLGSGVAIWGNEVTASAECATANGNPCQGAAYVFIQPRHGWSGETEAAKLTASDGFSNDEFGTAVGIFRDTLVASAPCATINGTLCQGALYVFVDPNDGFQAAAVNNLARVARTAALRRAAGCWPLARRNGMLARRLLWLRSGDRAGCGVMARRRR